MFLKKRMLGPIRLNFLGGVDATSLEFEASFSKTFGENSMASFLNFLNSS